MVKNLLNKLFGSLSGNEAAAANDPEPVSPAANLGLGSTPAAADLPTGEAEPSKFVEFVVKSLVDTPDEVAVSQRDDDRGTLIQISCRQDEVGRVIGKKGKTIEAIRSLVKASAARQDRKVSVVVAEP